MPTKPLGTRSALVGGAHPTRLWSLLLVGFVAVGGTLTCAVAAEVSPRPSSGCPADAMEVGSKLERTIDIDGVKRSYILDVPASIPRGTPVPLLFDFHGFGHSAAGVWTVSGFRELGTRERFITVYPDGLPVHLLGREGSGWEILSLSDNRDVKFVTHLLDQLERTYCVDRARV